MSDIIMQSQPQAVPLSANLITITHPINVKGFMFVINTQYCYQTELVVLVGCGCGGKKKKEVNHFRVVMNGIFYDIPDTHAVHTTQPIACEDQDFLNKRSAIGDTNIVQDFNMFRNNNDPMAIAAKANRNPM